MSQWISVKDKLPEQHESVFKCLWGTTKWAEGMFLKASVTVLVSIETIGGEKLVTTGKLLDKKWKVDSYEYILNAKVTHWMPLPEPPKTE